MFGVLLASLFHLSLVHGLAVARSAPKPVVAAGFDNALIAKVEANALAISTHRSVLYRAQRHVGR